MSSSLTLNLSCGLVGRVSNSLSTHVLPLSGNTTPYLTPAVLFPTISSSGSALIAIFSRQALREYALCNILGSSSCFLYVSVIIFACSMEAYLGTESILSFRLSILSVLTNSSTIVTSSQFLYLRDINTINVIPYYDSILLLVVR